MFRRHGFTALIVTIIFLVIAVSPSMAEIHERQKGFFGLKAGLLSSGTARSDQGQEIDVFNSFTGGFFLEFPIFRGDFLTGVAGDVYNLKFWSENMEPEILIDLSWTLKGNIGHRARRINIRPGVGIGFLFFKNTREIGVTGISLQAFTEFLFKTSDKGGFLADFGIIGSPSMGNAYVSGTAGPMPLLRLGLIF